MASTATDDLLEEQSSDLRLFKSRAGRARTPISALSEPGAEGSAGEGLGDTIGGGKAG